MGIDWKKPGEKWLLDLYCGAGGAAVGYYRAGFKIVGVDINPQPNYPFHFVQADAVEFCREYGHEFDVIHASPPCQKYSRTKSLHSSVYPDLIAPTREAIRITGKPYVMENVIGAPLIDSIILDGVMFGLKVVRKRKFESSVLIMKPGKRQKIGSVGGKNCTKKTFNGYYIVGGHQWGALNEWGDAMGIDWMTTKDEMAESIPPAYTEFIGREIFHQIKIEL